MRDEMQNIPNLTLGLDLGDRYSYFCLLDRDGTVVERGRVATTAAALQRRFGGPERMRVILEVGTHSPWVSRLVATCGHEVIVANPRRVRLIVENDHKTDRVDAELLARLGRVDPGLLRPIEHRGPRAQAALAVVRARDCHVRARSQLVNHVRGSVKALGSRLPRTSTSSFAAKVAQHIPPALAPALVPVLATIAQLTQQIRAYDRTIEELAQRQYPETQLLRQVTGVGPVTALTYVLTLEDPLRFARSRSVGAFLGLRPRKRDSGQRAPELSISKRGDVFLRRLLVSAAHYILGPFGPDCDLRRWGQTLAARGGKNAKKRAVVAVARRLAVLLHRLWVTGAVYEPLRHTTARVAA
jgi:transposase